MTSKFKWRWRTWNMRKLKRWRFTMRRFRTWFMVYKYQPHIISWLPCLGQACNHTSKLQLQGWNDQHYNIIRRQWCCVKKKRLLSEQRAHFQYHKVLNMEHHQKHKSMQGKQTSIAQISHKSSIIEWKTTKDIFICIVATLTLGSWPRQGLAKVRAKTKPLSHISCSRECKRMWENEPSHSQVNSYFGS
jgi:hypothetical protein